MPAVVLPDSTRALYPFKSHYLTLSDGTRLHYIDEGPEDGDVLLFAHGYATWSFLFRAFAIYYAALGYRCIVPDHVGFGLSDKPGTRRYHTLQRHQDNLAECIQELGLNPVTLVMEDWGGPLSLGYAITHPDAIKRLVIMNVWGFQDTLANRLNPLLRWATRPIIGELLFRSLNLSISVGLQRWSARRLSPSIVAAYRAPFRDPRSRTALVQFPRMINTTPSHPSAPLMRAIEQGLPNLDGVPTLVMWGAQNPLLSPDVASHWKALLPRARGPFIIEHAGHLLPEDAPDEVLQHLNEFLDDTG